MMSDWLVSAVNQSELSNAVKDIIRSGDHDSGMNEEKS